MVDAAVDMINERIAQDLGSLVEDRRRDDKPRERVSNLLILFITFHCVQLPLLTLTP
jgi:hypothetical protein